MNRSKRLLARGILIVADSDDVAIILRSVAVGLAQIIRGVHGYCRNRSR